VYHIQSDVASTCLKLARVLVCQYATLTRFFYLLFVLCHNSTAGRMVKTGLTASVIVSQWTWAATLLQSSNVAWQYGVSGPFWYVKLVFFIHHRRRERSVLKVREMTV
jgi:hypothetical protein